MSSRVDEKIIVEYLSLSSRNYIRLFEVNDSEGLPGFNIKSAIIYFTFSFSNLHDTIL